ncbi:MAG: hypothetical protein ACF8CQ_20145 [Rhodopirellula sp. JB044]|uniref:hypothetical protein n=1 Tax=Rhodopirellula sp. JB044 TaxID=3342844 RepID=UPI003709E704
MTRRRRTRFRPEERFGFLPARVLIADLTENRERIREQVNYRQNKEETHYGVPLLIDVIDSIGR